MDDTDRALKFGLFLDSLCAGVSARWGPESFNPEMPPEQRELNKEWLMREMSDVEGAFNRLWDELGGRPI